MEQNRVAIFKAWLPISLLMLAGSSSSLAADFKRFEFQPFGGFTVSGGIPLIVDDNTTYGSISVSSSYNVGATFGVNFNELDAVEGLWRRQQTEGRLPQEIAVPASSAGLTSFGLKIDQYHCNFLHHYQVSVAGVRPYVMGGLGVTTYYARRNGQGDSMSRFSFALGGGVKWLLTRHFGLRAEARWAPTLLSVSDSSFWCNIGGAGADCVIHLKTAVQSQLDLTGGIIIRF
jgi:opacity protein-like surface antigen